MPTPTLIRAWTPSCANRWPGSDAPDHVLHRLERRHRLLLLTCGVGGGLPEGAEHDDPEIYWFHKYVVDTVTEIDGTGDSVELETHYRYGGSPAWAYDDNEAARCCSSHFKIAWFVSSGFSCWIQ